MSTPAQVTEAHRELLHQLLMNVEHGYLKEATQLIADSEAKAVEAQSKAACHLLQGYIADRDQRTAELGQLHGRIGLFAKAHFGINDNLPTDETFAQMSHALQMERNGLAVEEEKLKARAERADEAIALRDMMSERDAAEAELAKAKAIIASIEEDGTEEHNAAVGLRQELAAERARLDWLLSRMGGNALPANKCVAWTVDVYHYGNRFPSRAAIDAAMKEETK